MKILNHDHDQVLVSVKALAKLTVDALILAIVVHVLEAAEDLDGRDVAASLVHNAFRAVCNKVLQEDQRLCLQNHKMREKEEEGEEGGNQLGDYNVRAHFHGFVIFLFFSFSGSCVPYFVDLAPFPGFLLGEALEDSGHDLVEMLAMLMWIRIEPRSERVSLCFVWEDCHRANRNDSLTSCGWPEPVPASRYQRRPRGRCWWPL